MKRPKVVIAMSGGVDSSVAAALLKQQGFEVIGVTMKLFSLPHKYHRNENLKKCCGRDAAEDAQRVAGFLDISHHVENLSRLFEKMVIADFCEEYSRGQTPNPCIRCNQHIKFKALMRRAEKLGAAYLATGHHARVMYDSKSGRYLLRKGRDQEKDQSYFLYTLTQKQLSRTLMPIGDFTKGEIREKAEELGLPVAKRPESQEICFVPDNDYVSFVKERIPEAFRPGFIVDIENRILGKHNGVLHFTIGQRRGMKIAAPHPLYVLDIRSSKNTIVVGTNDKLYKRSLLASRINLIAKVKITKPLAVKAKIRYKHKETKAILKLLDLDRALVEFEKAQRAVTPGQAVVFYDGDTVIGGGTIVSSRQ